MKCILSIMLLLICANSTAVAQATISVPIAATGVAGGSILGKAASKCLRHPVLCGVATAVGVGVYRYANRQADLAIARRQMAMGDPLSPPGYCPENQHSRLSALVDTLCKKAELIRCMQTDSSIQLKAKAFAFSECAKIRTKREDLCFRGGDAGHRQQIKQMWQAHDRCYSFAGMK